MSPYHNVTMWICDHYRAHSVDRLMLTSALVMLPVLTHGTVSAFLTIALPKLQKPNPTGLMIDLYQVSWLGKTFIEQVMGVGGI